MFTLVVWLRLGLESEQNLEPRQCEMPHYLLNAEAGSMFQSQIQSLLITQIKSSRFMCNLIGKSQSAFGLGYLLAD